MKYFTARRDLSVLSMILLFSFSLSSCSYFEGRFNRQDKSVGDIELYATRDSLLPRRNFKKIVEIYLGNDERTVESLLIIAGFPDDFGKMDVPGKDVILGNVFLLYEIDRHLQRNSYWLCIFNAKGRYESSLFFDDLAGNYKNLHGGMDLIFSK